MKNLNLSNKLLGSLIVIFGICGFVASFVLIQNKLSYLANPDFVPSCSINPLLDCGIVMKSKWASLFGFPNMIIGLAEYPMAILTGLFVTYNKTNNKYLMRFTLALSGIGLFINILLMYTSAILIQALCIWCIVSICSTAGVFFSLLDYNMGLTPPKNKYLVWYREKAHYITTIGFYIALFAFILISRELLRNGAIDPEVMPNLFFWV